MCAHGRFVVGDPGGRPREVGCPVAESVDLAHHTDHREDLDAALRRDEFRVAVGIVH